MRNAFWSLVMVFVPLVNLNASHFWQPSNGPYLKRVNCFAVNLSGDIFAGTIDGGVFRSTDGGASWAQTNFIPTNFNIRSLAINDSAHVFAGTYGGGVFRSTDNGHNWSSINNSLTDYYVTALAVGPAGGIFSGTDGSGVFRSTNNGNSWAQTALTNKSVYFLSINSNGDVFAVADGGVFRSTNDGANWIPINTGLMGNWVNSLTIHPGGDILAGTSCGGVFRSPDNGDHWNDIDSTDKCVLSLAINSSGHIFAGTDGSGIFRSTDNGVTWDSTNTGLMNRYAYSLAVGSNDHVFVGTQTGIFRSISNAANWVPLNTTLTDGYTYPLEIKSCAINGTGHVLTGTGVGVFRSTDNGANWNITGFLNSLVRSLAINDSGHVFAGVNNDIYRSTDSGDFWDPITPALTVTQFHSLAINSNGHLFAGTGDGVFRSTHNGDTLIRVGLVDHRINALSINSSDHIFAGTNSYGVFLSTDNGANWIQIDTGLTNLSVHSLAINSSNDVFAGTYGGIFRSTDNGAHWNKTDTGLTNPYVISLAVDSSGNVFAGTDGGGAFRSTDNGDHWADVNTGFTTNAAYVQSLAVSPNGDIFAGTYGGVFLHSERGVLSSPVLTAVRDAGTGDKIFIKWRQLNKTGVTGYEVSYGLSPGNYIFTRPVPEFGNAFDTVIFSGLTPHTAYYVAVRALYGAPDSFSTYATYGPVYPTIPVVLVHGWRGAPDTWDEMKSWLLSDHFNHLWVANTIDPCGVAGETLFEGNAERLSIFINGKREDLSAETGVPVAHIGKTNFVAHSMGGMIVRRFLAGGESWAASGQGISPGRVIMLGTPNGGMPISDIADLFGKICGLSNCLFGKCAKSCKVIEQLSLACPSGPAAAEFTSGKMDLFNAAFHNSEPTSKYILVAGILCDSYLPLPRCNWDGFVFRNSVYDLDGVSLSEKFTRTACHACIGAIGCSVCLYNSLTIYDEIVLPQLRSGEVLQQYYQAQAKTNVTSDDSSQVQFTQMRSADIRPFTAVEETLFVSNGMSFSCSIYDFESSLNVKLLSPSGDSSTGYSSLLGLTSFSISSPQSGNWVVRVTATTLPDTVWPFILLTDVDNGISLSTSLSPDSIRVGESLNIRARLKEGMVPKLNADISAIILLDTSDATNAPLFSDTLILSDNGYSSDSLPNDGIYGMVFQATAPGSLSALISADGMTAANDSFHKVAVQNISVKDMTTSVKDIQGQVPKVYSLSQNYPNPFNSNTEIRFSLPKSEFVALDLFNILGQQVRQLINENLPAGVKSVSWDGRDDKGRLLSSGIYLYRLNAGSFSETKKMMLIK